MMLKEFLISFLHYFVDITTGVLIAAAIFLTAAGSGVDGAILWEILLSGLITALPSALLVCLDVESVKLSVILWAGHFLLIYGLTLLLLKVFGWCELTPASVLIAFLAVAFIYVFTCLVHYLLDKKHTALMNRQLKKRYLNDKKSQ